MIEALYAYYLDNDLHHSRIGFFTSESEAKIALRGLCCWDFNDMQADGAFEGRTGFKFVKIPAELKNYDTTERDSWIQEARDHASKMPKGMWHKRSPKDWK